MELRSLAARDYSFRSYYSSLRNKLKVNNLKATNMTKGSWIRRGRPRWTAKRKERPLGEDDEPVSKRSKSTNTAGDPQDSPSAMATDDRQESQIFGSLQGHLDGVRRRNDEGGLRV
jgi:hypothetical protein